ncbi:hypothetical protein [Burkholderia sp. Bp9143]|uniref:hypothetical protein n=1 Tax=Burkholderia sp. Bp9143 TaxID=2184574 RepID=UPI0021AB913E|nr:hypothetical protein [Burkholderia sp. Bp9143]
MSVSLHTVAAIVSDRIGRPPVLIVGTLSLLTVTYPLFSWLAAALSWTVACRLARSCRTLSCGTLSRGGVRPDTGASRSRQASPRRQPAAGPRAAAPALPDRRSVRCANLE